MRSIRKDHAVFVIGDDGNKRSFFIDRGMTYILEEYGMIFRESGQFDMVSPCLFMPTSDVEDLVRWQTVTSPDCHDAKSIDYKLMALAFVQGVAWANNH